MCVVSMVSEFYGQWPKPAPVPFDWLKAAPTTLDWTPEALKLLKEIMAKVKELDTKLGLPDCEDPKKAEWMQTIEARLKALEAAEASRAGL